MNSPTSPQLRISPTRPHPCLASPPVIYCSYARWWWPRVEGPPNWTLTAGRRPSLGKVARVLEGFNSAENVTENEGPQSEKDDADDSA